jgi:hypothetical protein
VNVRDTPLKCGAKLVFFVVLSPFISGMPPTFGYLRRTWVDLVIRVKERTCFASNKKYAWHLRERRVRGREWGRPNSLEMCWVDLMWWMTSLTVHSLSLSLGSTICRWHSLVQNTTN